MIVSFNNTVPVNSNDWKPAYLFLSLYASLSMPTTEVTKQLLSLKAFFRVVVEPTQILSSAVMHGFITEKKQNKKRMILIKAIRKIFTKNSVIILTFYKYKKCGL